MKKRALSKVSTNIHHLCNKISRRRAKRWVMCGENHLAKGAVEEALACCRRSLSIHNDSKDAYFLMTRALMPGDDYISILSRFHDCMKPESYVEIGVGSGKSLALTKRDTKAIGIEPNFRTNKIIKSHAKIYPMTSDDFFESYNLIEELGASRLSFAFIDGLHLFEQVLKDFINLERYAERETLILIHDCLPITKLVAARVRTTKFWCGDVWRVIACLNTYRPDLTIGVIPTRPSGLGIITNLDPKSKVLTEAFDQIVTECRMQDLGYDYLDLDKEKVLNIVPNDWQQISKILSLPPMTETD